MTSQTPEESFTPISTLGEFGLIDRIRERIGPPKSSSTAHGIGDDAAVLDFPDDTQQVVTTDLLIEHVHFDRTYTPMRHLGYKAMTSNISDVTAMFALADAATVSLGIPNTISVEMIDALYEGIGEACEQYGVDVVGGDISASHKFIISITVIGHAPAGELVFRTGASPSDLLCVSGTLGGSYAGLRILQHHKNLMTTDGSAYKPDLQEHMFVIQRHLRPDARPDILAGLRLAGVQPTSMIDISDGLASEVRHLCTESGSSARVFAGDVPIDDRTASAAAFLDENALDYALYGGEEYELLFTIRREDADKLNASSADVSIVGEVLATGTEPEIAYPNGSVAPLMAEGFRHF